VLARLASVSAFGVVPDRVRVIKPYTRPTLSTCSADSVGKADADDLVIKFEQT
jgi:hypothetical protein